MARTNTAFVPRRLASCILLALSPAWAQNVVRNGHFDAGLSGWTRPHRSASDAIQVAEEETGTALRMTCADGDYVDLCSPVSLQPGGEYLFQFRTRRSLLSDRVRAFVLVERKAGKDMYFNLGQDQAETDRWTPFVRRVRAPANLEQARTYLVNGAPESEAWFDDVQVVPLTPQSGPGRNFRPALLVPELSKEPVLDGRVDADEWAGAGRVTGFVRVHDGASAEAGTQVFVARDSTRLLIAARCEEPHMQALRKGVRGHDAGGVFADECLEIFLDPDRDQRSYYHFALGAGGADYDSSRGMPPADGTAFESGWTTAVARSDDHWSAEVAIPFSSLATAGAGDVWGLNVARERHVAGHAENTAWSATGTSFHTPRRFGDIAGLAAAARPEVTAELRWAGDHLLPGPVTLEAGIANRTDTPRRVTASLLLVRPDGTGEAVGPTTATIPPAGEQVLPFSLEIGQEQRGSWRVGVQVTDPATGRRLCRTGDTTVLVPPLLQARVVDPWWRGRIFSSMGMHHARLEARVGAREEARRGWRVRAELTMAADDYGKNAGKVVDADVVELTLPVADMPFGDGRVAVVLTDGAGRELASIRDLPLTRLAQAPWEFWFDRLNNLVVNGEKRVPTGFYSTDHTQWFERIRKAGYTVGHSYRTQTVAGLGPAGTTRPWMAELEAAGLQAFVGLGYHGNGGGDPFATELLEGKRQTDRDAIAAFIRDYRRSPALLGWYLYDEPSLAGRTPEEIAELYRLADELDPYHPKLVCQVYWSDARFVDSLDVLMPDPYPIRAAGSRPLRSVATAVLAARRTVRDEKPVWPVLQWYQYPKGRFPTPTEMRCMAMMAVAAGAKGLTWYSWYHGIRGDAKHCPDIFRIGAELRALEPFILAPEAPCQFLPEAAEHGDALICLTKLVREDTATQWVVLAVNAEDRRLDTVRFPLPDAAPDAPGVRAWFDAEPPALSGGSLVDSFAPYEAKVYSLTPR